MCGPDLRVLGDKRVGALARFVIAKGRAAPHHERLNERSR